MKTDNNSFRHFPPDLFIASGIPWLALMLFLSWMTSLRGWPWTAALGTAFLVAILGAVDLFRAKLPLYRERRFFTLGSRDLSPPAKALFRRGCWLSGLGICFASMLVTQPQLLKGF